MDQNHAEDPNVASIHGDLREHFAVFYYVFAAVLGLGAVVAGIAFGILLAND